MKLYEYVIKVKDNFSNELKRFADGAKKAEGSLKDIDTQVGKTGKGMGDLLKFAGGNLLANVFSFAAAKAGDLLGRIIDVTGQFQKYMAVLGNTLGSKSAAQRDLGMLQDLAAQTNYSMMELTDGYVKLVNRGMKPTRDELMQLADLANSTGKSYDQLVEAILDAQTGQFERLKEFGITASKSGDKVKFSFKGVTKEVQFTSNAIGDYIKGLGKLEGVTGSTAEISKTLTGQISNLGDAWDSMLNNMGKRSDGVFNSVISGLQKMVGWMDQVAMSQEEFNRKNNSPKLTAFEKQMTDSFGLNAFSTETLGKKAQQVSLAAYYDGQAMKIKSTLTKLQVELRETNKFIDGSLWVGDAYITKQKTLENSIMFQQDKFKALKDVYANQLKALDKPAEIALGKSKSKASSGVKASVDDTIRGGVRATTVNITIGKMIEKMAENMSFNSGKDAANEVEKAVLETLNRVINGAVYTARQ